jgi:hypothetical protein
MRPLHRLLAASLLTGLAGCNSTSTGPSDLITPSPQPKDHVVSGVLSKTVDGVSRPLPGRTVYLWIQQPMRGWSQAVTTDQNGRYSATVATSRIFASATHPPDEQQPCLASAAVAGDTTLDLAVGPIGTPAVPPADAHPLVTGFVYETTPHGRNPLKGVPVSVEASPDVWVAFTRTDDAGRFYLCRVNTPVRMVVSAGNGYQDWWQSISGVADLEIELRR